MIQVIAILLIVLSLLALAYRRPKLGFSMLVALMVLVLMAYLFSKNRMAAPSNKLEKTDILLQAARVESGYAGSQVLRATLSNQHPVFNMQEALISSTLYACPQPTALLADCELFGLDDNTIRIFIPPQGVKDIAVSLNVVKSSQDDQLSAQAMRLKKAPINPRWQHQVERVE